MSYCCITSSVNIVVPLHMHPRSGIDEGWEGSRILSGSARLFLFVVSHSGFCLPFFPMMFISAVAVSLTGVGELDSSVVPSRVPLCFMMV